MAKPEQQSGVLGLQANLDKKTNPYVQTSDMWEVQGFYPKESLSLTKRKGFTKFNLTQSAVGLYPVTFTGLFEYVPSTGSRQQIAVGCSITSLDPLIYHSDIYRYGTPVANQWNALSLSNIAAGQPLGTIDQLWDAATLEDQMYMGNGVDSNMRWDGLHPTTPALYEMGIVQPDETAMTATAGATGALSTGHYQYLVTFVNRLGHESNPGPWNDTTSVFVPAEADATAGQKITLTDVPISADAQVTERNIYRTTADGGIFLYCDTIADNSTTTYVDDTVADVDLAEEIELFANGVPPLFSMIEIHRGVAFMAAPSSSRVYFSWPGTPGAVDSNDFRDLDPNDGDVITGIHKFQNTLIVTKNNSVWVLIGEDRNTFGFEKRVTSAGAISNKSILEIPTKNLLIMLSNHPRFFLFDGAICAPTAAEIEPVLRGLTQSKLDKCVGAVLPSENQLRWIVPDTNKEYCSTMIWYDYVLDKWGTVDLSTTPANYCVTMRNTANVLRFYLCSAYDLINDTGGGYVYLGDEGGTDDGTNITCSVTDRGHPQDDPSPENQKSFYHVFVWYKKMASSPATLTIKGIKDDPDGTPITIGTVVCSADSGQAHLHMNIICRRLYIQVEETGDHEDLVLRGWRVYYKDLGRHHAV